MTMFNSKELFDLKEGSKITKRNLYDLIQYSKVEGSDYWSGHDYKINNTPQQVINWMGNIPDLKALIIKTKKGAYKLDGWLDSSKEKYNYSFKSQKNEINYNETANAVILNQIKYFYPILLFSEDLKDKKFWIFEGFFNVEKNESEYVTMQRKHRGIKKYDFGNQEDFLFKEGSIKYITHLSRERNKEAVDYIKSRKPWLCDICNTNFSNTYGEDYIEAHHKEPISSFTKEYKLSTNDLVLLCPNCHKATHIYMKKYELDYEEIKNKLKKLFLSK
jgi:putative restriction endonuclease